MDILQALKDEGVTVVEVNGWRSRAKPGIFAPVGVISHHTAAGGFAAAPSLGVCTNGRAGLSGPLCNVLVGRDAKAYLISAGRANDSGKGSGIVLHEVIQNKPPTQDAHARRLRQDTDGNPYFYDVEVENNGTGEAYSGAVLDTTVRVVAALCRLGGWDERRTLHHRQWSTEKIDMSYRGDFRALVGARLRARQVSKIGAPNMNRFPGSVDSCHIPGWRGPRGERGMWVVGHDGGVGAYPKGLAPFHGSMGDTVENAPMAAILPWGADGYVLIGQDTGTFSFPIGGRTPQFRPFDGMVKTEWARGDRAIVNAEFVDANGAPTLRLDEVVAILAEADDGSFYDLKRV